MTSHHTLAILALAVIAQTACARSSSGPGAAHSGPQVLPGIDQDISPDISQDIGQGTSPGTTAVAPPEPVPLPDEQPTDGPDASLEGASPVSDEVAPDEQPRDATDAPGPRLAPSSLNAPMTSVDPRRAAIEAEDDAPATGEVSPSPNVDLSFQDGPLFPDDDPLESSEIPVCRALVAGLKACWPKVDEEIRQVMEPLVASILNSPRSLRRPFVRKRACEMGYDAIPRMFESFCSGAFEADKPDAE